MKISIVVAVAENMAIGAKGDLLWRLPADMQHFKTITWGHYVLMGRKTYESIPEKFRPLPGRTNIVVTKNPDIIFEGCTMVHSLEEGIEAARSNGEAELMIIGGGEIYHQAFPHCDKIYLTRVHYNFGNADTFFPPIDPEKWIEIKSVHYPADARHAHAFDIIELLRGKKMISGSHNNQ